MRVADTLGAGRKKARRSIRRLRKLRRTIAAGYITQARSGLVPSWEHEHLADLAVGTVVDVGANRGQFTQLAHRIFPTAPIVAFEPIPAVAATYRRFAPHTAVLHELALGDQNTTAQLNVLALDHSSSLLPVGALQRQLFSGTEVVETIDVDVRRLDSLLDDNEMSDDALLKIDVQGTELATLRGCGALLERFRWVYVECSFGELYEGQDLAGAIVMYLGEHGFSLARMANAQHTPQQICDQADFLFERVR